MRATFAACCARAASGHAIEPPSRVTNSRRFIAYPRPQDYAEFGFQQAIKTEICNLRNRIQCQFALPKS
jgi:hypothetical protein